MTLVYFILCIVFVIFLIKFFIHCCEIKLCKKSHKKFVKNMNQYENTIAGALDNDRINEKRKTQ